MKAFGCDCSGKVDNAAEHHAFFLFVILTHVSFYVGVLPWYDLHGTAKIRLAPSLVIIAQNYAFFLFDIFSHMSFYVGVPLWYDLHGTAHVRLAPSHGIVAQHHAFLTD